MEYNKERRIRRCINRNHTTCFICNKVNKLHHHHISRIPEITIKVCNKCHLEIEQNKDEYEELIPNYTVKGMRFIKWVYNQKGFNKTQWT